MEKDKSGPDLGDTIGSEWLLEPNAAFVARLTRTLYPAAENVDLLPPYEEMLVLRKTLGQTR